MHQLELLAARLIQHFPLLLLVCPQDYAVWLLLA